MSDPRLTPLPSRRTNSVYGIPPSPTKILSTAYNGAAGDFEENSTIATLESDADRADTSTRSTSPQREGLGSRLLSTLSSAQPAAAALRRSGSVLHSRTKSWAAYVPKLNANTSATSDRVHYNRIFGDLFNGESAPIRLGLPVSDPDEGTDFVMEYRSGFTERPIKRLQRIDTSATTSQAAPKSSWFKRKSMTPATPLPNAVQDELLTLNIHNSLFPDGSVDPLSPHAFNDLLLNATNLLQRMQASYREKVEYINSIQPEMDAQKEEAEEADTRAQHLKLQLEDMCRRAQDQDAVNRELALELSDARLKLQEPEQKTIRLVQRANQPDRQRDGNVDGDEDEDTTPRRHKRASAGSASDSGFESDADTSSLFSTTLYNAAHPRMTLTSAPDYEGNAWGGNARAETGMVLEAGRRDANNKCIVGDNPAWSTVEKLRSDNVALQRQLEEMQRSLQGCIDFVGGVTGK